MELHGGTCAPRRQARVPRRPRGPRVDDRPLLLHNGRRRLAPDFVLEKTTRFLLITWCVKTMNCRFVQGRHPCRGWFVGNAGRRDQRVGLTHFHAALAWRVQKKALEWSSSVHREPIRLRPNTSLSMSRRPATDRRALRPTTASLSRLTTRGDGGNAERATTAFRQRRQAEAEYYRMEALLSKIGLLCASDVLSASLRRESMCLVVSG